MIFQKVYNRLKERILTLLLIVMGFISIPICGNDATAAVILVTIGVCSLFSKEVDG